MKRLKSGLFLTRFWTSLILSLLLTLRHLLIKVTKVVVLGLFHLGTPGIPGIRSSPQHSISSVYMGLFDPRLSNLSSVLSVTPRSSRVRASEEERQLCPRKPPGTLLPRLNSSSEPRLSSGHSCRCYADTRCSRTDSGVWWCTREDRMVY